MLIIGCDYHPSVQQIAMVDTETGECQERRLAHRAEAEHFYRALRQQGVSGRVGIEATGHSRWFERLLAELGFEVWIGDPARSKMETNRGKKKRTQRAGVGVSRGQPFHFTQRTYLYRVTLHRHDLPVLPPSFWAPDIAHTTRDAWTLRKGRDLLLRLEPDATVERYHARRCPSCGRWFLGNQAEMLREIIEVARIHGNKVTCSKTCAMLTA